MGFLQYMVAFFIILVCCLLIVIILLQKGRGGGLSAAFGGGGSGSAFGAKTGDVFTWVTVAFALLYLLLNVAGSFAFRQVAEEPEATTITAPQGEGAGETTTPPGVEVLPVQVDQDAAPAAESEVPQESAPDADANQDEESAAEPDAEGAPEPVPTGQNP